MACATRSQRKLVKRARVHFLDKRTSCNRTERLACLLWVSDDSASFGRLGAQNHLSLHGGTAWLRPKLTRQHQLHVQGQLKTLVTLLEAEGPGAVRVRFCMASALATLVLDEDVMHAVKDRGEAPMLFVHAIEILKGALARLDPAAAEPPDDPDLTVRMAEAMAQAMWGAAYYCTLPEGGGVEDHHVTSLGTMGVSTWTNTQCGPAAAVCATAGLGPCVSVEYEQQAVAEVSALQMRS